MYSIIGCLYGILILQGRKAFDEEHNPDNLPVIPEKYREDVLEYFEYLDICYLSEYFY